MPSITCFMGAQQWCLYSRLQCKLHITVYCARSSDKTRAQSVVRKQCSEYKFQITMPQKCAVSVAAVCNFGLFLNGVSLSFLHVFV